MRLTAALDISRALRYGFRCVIGGLLLAVGCQGTTQTSPEPPLTGRWVEYGTDTYSQFYLEERGTVITGTFGGGSAVRAATTAYPVTGTALLPSLTLHWTEQNGQQRYPVTFIATLAADSQTIMGTMSIDGQPTGPTPIDSQAPGPTLVFRRAP